MIIKSHDKDNITALIIKEELENINIYNEEEILNLLKEVIKKIINKRNISGNLYLDIYIDKYYGMIINAKIKELKDKVNIDIKLTFHINNIFLYKLDYFNKGYLPKNTYNIYYYKNNYYLELTQNISKRKYYKLLENSFVTTDTADIISEGIKL